MQCRIVFYILGGLGLLGGAVLLISFDPMYDAIIEKVSIFSNPGASVSHKL